MSSKNFHRSKKRSSKASSHPEWLLWLCAICLVPMFTQIRLPLWGGKLALGDLAFLVAFLAFAITTILQKRNFFLADGIVLLLGFGGIVSLCAGPGKGGAFELAQLFQQFFGGFLLLKFLVSEAPRRTCVAVAVALLLNSATALAQVFRYGFGAVLPPADVLAVPWGFGGAFTGLFRSRTALAFFQATALLWLLPHCFPKRFSWWKSIGATLFTMAVLLSIAHGQILFLTVLLLSILATSISRRAAICIIGAILLSGAALMLPPCVHHRTVILASLSPLKTKYPGELKTNHLDFAAALRMARKRPLKGVGPGRYQEFIGQCYGDLPNPSWNDIETDTQASWGILAGCYGIPFVLLLFFLLARQAGRNLTSSAPLAQSANAVILFTILAMFLTDPWTRGTCWMPLLAIAAADGRKSRPYTFPLLLCVAIPLSILLCAVFLRPKAEIRLNTPVRTITQKPQFLAANDLFLILDAEEAKNITAPVEKGTDSTAAKNTILKIPDGKGNPKEDQLPAMEFGGAAFEFEVPEDATVRIWVRVWWSGSCGNTINLRLDDEKSSHTIGNDGMYGSWHWLEAGTTFSLKAGKHTLELLNREDGIQFDQMLITNQLNYVPQGIEE